jgi:non-homologous end joining protein Ku
MVKSTDKTAKQIAKEEVEKEQFDKNKDRYKAKLTDLIAAKKVVKNLERELEDLDDEIEGN